MEESSSGLYKFWFLVVAYLFLLFALKIFVHLWWKPRRIQNHFFRQGIRGPEYHFFFGNLKELANLAVNASSQPMPHSHDILPRVLSFYHHWKKLYGASFLVWFGPTARLTITDPALIRDIFVLKSEFFEKNESPPFVRKLEGDGLLTLKGEKWAHHRKVLTPTFRLENLKLMIPVMEKSVGEMLEQWSKISKDGKVEIEISEYFQTLAEDVITRTVFGSSYEEGRAIFKLQSQQMAHATEAYQKVFIPGYSFLPTKKNRNSWRLDREMRKSLMKLIEDRRNYYYSYYYKNYSKTTEVVSEECPNDLLELMIRASFEEPNENYCYSNSSSSSTITVHDIVEECKTTFFAGKHTTSNLMTWTTVLLAMHPQWQDLAREEVLRVCGARDPPKKDDIVKLKTLGMILNESLRLYPPAVATIRRAKVDAELGGFSIPRGIELLIPILAIHHDQALWGHDAGEFNPSRFGKGVAHAASHPMAFMPFGLGARRCIGQNLAILQAKLAIAMILQRFSIALAPSYKHAPTVLMLLYPQYGAPVILQKL